MIALDDHAGTDQAIDSVDDYETPSVDSVSPEATDVGAVEVTESERNAILGGIKSVEDLRLEQNARSSRVEGAESNFRAFLHRLAEVAVSFTEEEKGPHVAQLAKWEAWVEEFQILDPEAQLQRQDEITAAENGIQLLLVEQQQAREEQQAREQPDPQKKRGSQSPGKGKRAARQRRHANSTDHGPDLRRKRRPNSVEPPVGGKERSRRRSQSVDQGDASKKTTKNSGHRSVEAQPSQGAKPNTGTAKNTAKKKTSKQRAATFFDQDSVEPAPGEPSQPLGAGDLPTRYTPELLDALAVQARSRAPSPAAIPGIPAGVPPAEVVGDTATGSGVPPAGVAGDDKSDQDATTPVKSPRKKRSSKKHSSLVVKDRPAAVTLTQTLDEVLAA